MSCFPAYDADSAGSFSGSFSGSVSVPFTTDTPAISEAGPAC